MTLRRDSSLSLLTLPSTKSGKEGGRGEKNDGCRCWLASEGSPRCCCSHNGPKGGGGGAPLALLRTTMRREGWKASSLQKSLSAIFGVLPSLSLSLSLSIGLVSLSLLLYIHSLVYKLGLFLRCRLLMISSYSAHASTCLRRLRDYLFSLQRNLKQK